METYEDILTGLREAYEKESGHRPEDVSDTGLRLRVFAGELYRLWAKLSWLERQAFPQTASGEWLDRHGAQRGVVRREAEHARGTLTFSRYLPLSFDVVIPKGTVCAAPGEEPMEYETLSDAVLETGKLSVDVPAQAVEGGRKGNAGAGCVNTLVEPTTTVNYVTNKAAFTGGREKEEDEVYRQRVLGAYANPSNGTNAAYYRETALACEGVSAAGVLPRANGANTVSVYIRGKDGAPSAETIARLQAVFSKEREMGVTVSVQAAAEKAVDVKVRLKVKPEADFSRAAEDAKKALGLYFSGLTMGSPVYLAELEKVILNAVPAVRLEFPSTVRDVAGETGVIPVLGTATVEEIA